MSSKEKLYRLLYISLLEIRNDACISGNKKTFEIANLIHNLPLKLNTKAPNFDAILTEIVDSSAENKGLKDLLNKNFLN